MGQLAYPFDNAPLGEAEWVDMMVRLGLTGIDGYPGSSDLAVFADSSGLQVKVPPGVGMVAGTFFKNDTELVIGITPNLTSSPRIDRIAIIRSLGSDTAALSAIPGSPSTTPSPPFLTQDVTGLWQESIAQVAVAPGTVSIAPAAITDEREFLGIQPKVAASLGSISGLIKPGQLINVQGTEYWWTGTRWAAMQEKVADSGWITVGAGVFYPGWTNYTGGGGYAPDIEYRVVGNLVALRGQLVKVGAGAANTIYNVFSSLPIAARPSVTHRWGAPVSSGSEMWDLFMTNTGAMSVITASATGAGVSVPLDTFYYNN